MGNFYTNISIKTADADRLAEILRQQQCDAYLLSVQEWTVVFDRASDEMLMPLEPLTALISREMGSVALAVLDHDDDVLMYLLYRDGAKLDEYNSRPGFFTGEKSPPEGGKAGLLGEAVGFPDRQKAIQAILHPDQLPVFAFEQHQQLVEALSLPSAAVASGFRYIAAGDCQLAGLRKVGAAP